MIRIIINNFEYIFINAAYVKYMFYMFKCTFNIYFNTLCEYIMCTLVHFLVKIRNCKSLFANIFNINSHRIDHNILYSMRKIIPQRVKLLSS